MAQHHTAPSTKADQVVPVNDRGPGTKKGFVDSLPPDQESQADGGGTLKPDTIHLDLDDIVTRGLPTGLEYHYYEHREDDRHRAPYPRHRHRRHRISNVEDPGDASVIPLFGMPGNVEDPGNASIIPLRGMPGEDSSSAPDSSAPDSHSPPDEHP